MSYIKQLAFFSLVLAGLCLFSTQQVLGQDLVYTPKNPAFGGNPYNYSWMLNSATTQNPYTSRSGYGYQRDPMADFQQSLQRQILSELTRNLVQDRFGEDFDFSQESNLEFGEFSINVSPGIDGVSINIHNILTGEETNITIPNVN
ncbi:MAG TPA: curli assembly protein CsgF [Fodinibius sp.]|nr:curli assembly protein CsgF [Fodinibius sp.]